MSKYSMLVFATLTIIPPAEIAIELSKGEDPLLIFPAKFVPITGVTLFPDDGSESPVLLFN